MNATTNQLSIAVAAALPAQTVKLSKSAVMKAAHAIQKAAAKAWNCSVREILFNACLEMARAKETFCNKEKTMKPTFKTWDEVHEEDIENSHGDIVAQKTFTMPRATENKDFWIAEIVAVKGGRKNNELNGFKRNFLQRKQKYATDNITTEEGTVYEAKILDDRFFFFLDHEGETVRIETEELIQILLKLNPTLVKVWENATFN